MLKGQREAMRESIRTPVCVCSLFQFADPLIRRTISRLAYRILHLTSRISHLAYSHTRISPRVSALTVLQTYLEEAKDLNADKTFVYISAEDIFRPVIPARYITTKREAENEIADLCEANGHNVRPVFIRPSTCFSAILSFEVRKWMD